MCVNACVNDPMTLRTWSVLALRGKPCFSTTDAGTIITEKIEKLRDLVAQGRSECGGVVAEWDALTPEERFAAASEAFEGPAPQ